MAVICMQMAQAGAQQKEGEANIIAGELQLDSKVTIEVDGAVLCSRVQLTRQQGKPIIRDNQIS